MTATERRIPSPTYFKPAPSEIQYGKMRFLITDRPSDSTIQNYIGVFNFEFLLRLF